MPEKKPHILLLISDEHRPDVLPVEGNEVVRTPVLDRFIGEGVYFRNAYTPSPVCVAGPPEFSLRSLSAAFRLSRFLDRLAERGIDHTKPSFPLWLPGSGCGEDAFSRAGPDARLARADRSRYIGKERLRVGRRCCPRRPHRARAGDRSDSVINTPNNKFAKEIMNARAGEGTWMKQDRYSVDGMVQFLDEYFASENYDRPGAQPLLLAVSLSCPHYPFHSARKSCSTTTSGGSSPSKRISRRPLTATSCSR